MLFQRQFTSSSFMPFCKGNIESYNNDFYDICNK